MLAKRFPSILPDLSFEEALEVTKIHSIAGLLSEEKPIVLERPFQSPHHTITTTALIGGGRIPKPGEISLAHYGVLFLDELPEFNKNVIESLRGPLEDEKVSISRLNMAVTYPCKVILLASMNPCPCGFYGSDTQRCSSTKQKIQRYMNKISGPLLDRMDLQVEVNRVPYQELNSDIEEESSLVIKKRVNKARKIQQERYKGKAIFSNSELSPGLINKYCKLDNNSKKVLRDAFEKLSLSARAYERILKVARTIADLENSSNIKLEHVVEAIQYRTLDRKYFN